MIVKYYDDGKECQTEAIRLIAQSNIGEKVSICKPSEETNGRWAVKISKENERDSET